MYKSSMWEKEICSFEDIKSQYHNCIRCPLHQKRTQVVFWGGPDQALIMAIGEAPGKDEDRLGFPFAGKAGQESLDRMFRYLGVNRNQIHISNACLCRPTDGYKNLKPTLENMKACSRRLLAEIRLTSPKVIVTMGKSAAVATFGANPSSSMTYIRGWHEMVYVVNGIRHAIPVKATWHPSFEMRQRQMGNKSIAAQMTSDWQEALEIVTQVFTN